MQRYLLGTFIIFCSLPSLAQQHSMAVGIYTGIAAPFTMDEGINVDSRYKQRYNIKFAPIGLTLSRDYDGYGIMATPGIVNIGQSFYVVNTSGGQDGLRKIALQYANIPLGFKLHIIDLSFFRVSAVASISAAYLLKGKETISHSDSKLKFPSAVIPNLPPDYIEQYDGVIVPTVTDYVMLNKSDFKPWQVFAGIGFRSDWDISDSWRVSFDFRGNYGIFDTRTDAYMEKLNSYQTLYDVPGLRRELFAQLTFGVSRYLEFDKSDRERKKNIKGSSKRYKPKTKNSRKTSRPRH